LIAALFDRESRRLTSTLERKKLHLKARPVFEAAQIEATVVIHVIQELTKKIGCCENRTIESR